MGVDGGGWGEFNQTKKKYETYDWRELILEKLWEDIPVKVLDWETKTAMNNSTSLWDLFFDFQNLPDEAFKNKNTLSK